MKNFIISYSGREGSTAIISTLSNHPDIIVPTYEGLDPYKAEQLSPRPSEKNYATALNNIYTFGIKFKPDHFFKQLDGPPLETGKVVGLKWRLNFITPDTVKILKHHGVHVFALLRENILDTVASQAISEVIKEKQSDVKSSHFQFMLRNAGDKRALLRKEIEENAHEIAPQRFAQILKTRIRVKVHTLTELHLMKALGLRISILTYEKFRDKPADFFQQITEEIQLPKLQNMETDFEKVSSLPFSDRVANWHELTNAPETSACVDAWQTLLENYKSEFS